VTNAGKWIYAKLAADAPVTALVGAAPNTRVRKQRAKEGDSAGGQAYIVYRRLNTDNLLAHDGLVGLKAGRHEVNCYAGTQEIAEDLAKKVIDALAKISFPNTAGGVVCQACILDDDSDAIEMPAYGDEVGRAFVSLDLIAWIEE